MNWIIYVLKCPRTHAVRYVGWTNKSPQVRLKNHINEALRAARTYKTKWLLSLVNSGLKPIIEAIESGSGDDWAEAERRWIAHYRASGARLVNATDGGDGVVGWGTPEQRTAKNKTTWEKMTPAKREDVGRKISAAFTPERRAAFPNCITPEQRRIALMKARQAQSHWGPEKRSEISRKSAAARTPEQRSESARKRQAARTPEQRSESARKREAAMTPEQKTARRLKQLASMTPAQRSASSKKAQANITREERSARAKKQWADRTPEERSACARASAMGRTPEQRREAARHAANVYWAARRAHALEIPSKI